MSLAETNAKSVSMRTLARFANRDTFYKEIYVSLVIKKENIKPLMLLEYEYVQFVRMTAKHAKPSPLAKSVRSITI